MDYRKLYNTLYKEGYHIGNEIVNIGRTFTDMIVENYEFNSILDIGCSQGLAVQQYQQLGKAAFGMDVSSIGIEKAKELGIENCRQGSIIKMPYKTNRFDAVVSTDVLEHLHPDDLETGLFEVCRVAKKYLFLKIAQKKEGNKRWIKLIKEKYSYEFPELDNLHTSVFRHAAWIELIEKYNKFKFKERLHRILVFERV